MYIGTIDPNTVETYTVNNLNKFIKSSITYIPGLFKIFDEAIVNAIDHSVRTRAEIAEGKTSSTILTGLSKFSPGLDVRGLLLSGLALAPGAYSQSPEAMAAGATLGALGLGARGARNVLAQRYARDLAAGIRRGDVAAPVEFNRMLTLSPTAQQLLLQPEYAP